ncbi:MAG: mercury methylation corrinoid protein HgcA [candidate division KSB1 bacterium]|nr:mercury methylation corrinoid protein HgcA [candidate division KSB1 bacterium]
MKNAEANFKERKNKSAGEPSFVLRQTQSQIGIVPIVSTQWGWRERLGAWKVRWGIKRMKYAVQPGIYGVGEPDADSPVLVTSNYKLTFDTLRRELENVNAWILVLDTHAINVWCAAGKGTFGTDALISQIHRFKLSSLVNHRTVIVPQLGAVGVAAHSVRKQTGFRVKYGPVYADDVEIFLENGMKATTDMRRVHFTLAERLVLVPMEFIPALKWFALIVLFFTSLNVLAHGSLLPDLFIVFMPYVAALLIGTVLVPVLLPWIPFRSFALKGAFVSVIFVLVWDNWFPTDLQTRLIHLLLIPALGSYLAVNFTGSTPLTSLSGVQKELRTGIPAMISAAVLGCLLYGIFLFI